MSVDPRAVGQAGTAQDGLNATEAAPARPERAAPVEREHRIGRRRTGPARERVAANDDIPSIGTLIYALQQKPTNTPFQYATISTAIWIAVSAVVAWAALWSNLKAGDSLPAVLVRPESVVILAVTIGPIALIWFLALLIWRAQELRLMSSAMTEVAIRLAEPDRMAEQSIAALGQTVRRQVSAMNDAISRAIGRAGELEMLVHNEVSALERSYDENENRIRNLIDELVSEREALMSGSERVAETLKGVGQTVTDNIYSAGASVAEELSDRGNVLHASLSMISQRVGSELPGLLEKLSREQGRLAEVVDGATSNLDALQSALDERTSHLDTSLNTRTKQLQSLLQNYSTTIDTAIAEHADTLSSRLGQLTQTIENTNIHIENVLAGRTDALDAALVERTKAIDLAFATRMAEIDESIERSSFAVENAISRGLKSVEAAVAQGTSVVDSAIGNRVDLLRSALERHASNMGSTLRQQSDQLEQTLVQGLEAMRRNTETIAQQSVQTVNGLSTQGRMLKEVSEGLIGQLQGLVDRFDHQSRMVSQVSSALDASHNKLNSTSHDMASQLGRLARDFDVMTQNVQSHMANLPAAARDSASGVRLALQDQIRALDTLAQTSREQRTLRDVVPPEGQDLALRQAPSSSMMERLQFSNSLSPTGEPVPGLGREGWSLGDLLARASRDDGEPVQPTLQLPAPGARSAQPTSNGGRDGPAPDLSAMASAIDPVAAAAVWARYRGGERGAIGRSMYTATGQKAFDQIAARLQSDAEFRAMAERYVSDFERVLHQSDQRDPLGRLTQSQIQSETGRVYLMFAHATGRLG